MDADALKQAFEEFSSLCDASKEMISGEHCSPCTLDYAPAAKAISAKQDGVEEQKQEPKVEETIDNLRKQVCACTLCRLSKTRHHVVYGEGVEKPLVMIIGEGPGADEDQSGRPFVGRSGQYLDTWLAPISLSREKNVFIGNIVKCRPPENRVPEPDEIDACIPYLKKQIQFLQPKLLLLVGATAAHGLLGRFDGVGKLRGEHISYQGIPVVVTYHPSGVLRNPMLRRPVWEDMKRVAKILSLPIVRG